YATDDRASEENTARAIDTRRRSSRKRSVSNGDPRSQRFQLISLHQEVDRGGDEDPVPREGAERGPAQEGDERPHRRVGGDERDQEADGERRDILRAEMGPALQEIVEGRRRHHRHGRHERVRRRGPSLQTAQEPADDGRPGARHARPQGRRRSRNTRRSRPPPARMAPSWMKISKVSAVSPLNPSRWPATMRWPVDETGRNSVRPSTIPSRIAIPMRPMGAERTGTRA